MRWDYVYEEEHFDVNGHCCAGILTNGKHYLFFTVSCDEPGAPETCRIYSSISFCQESLECHFIWTAENDELLLECLNSLEDGISYCGKDSPIRVIHFVPSENK